MALSLFLRVSGIAAIIGGAILFTAPFSQYYCPPTAAGLGCSLLKGSYLLSAILILLGIVGIYIGQSSKAGKFGMFSFLAAFIGGSMYIGAKWMHVFVEPAFRTIAPDLMESDTPPLSILIGFMTTFPLLTIGWLLFGISIVKSKIFPKWAAILVIAGHLLDFMPIPLPISPILVGFGLTWLGYAVYQQKELDNNLGDTISISK